MKKSVLFALLGMTVQGVEQKESESGPTPQEVQLATELVQQIASLDEKQDEYDHMLEMEQADVDADAIIEREDQEEEENFAGIDADINADAGPAKKKNKDSSDDECACAPPQASDKQKKTIMAKQAKKASAAKKAKAAAIAAKQVAELAIKAANEAKRTGAKNVLELAKAAEEAISKATAAENMSIEKQTDAETKTTVFSHEKYDLKTKTTVKTWEETVVSKHEIWETYKSIKKNFRISLTNVKLVRQNLKAAENKVVQLRKTSALNPKDIGAKEKVTEAEDLVTVIRKQLLDAETQKDKVNDEMKSSQTKAREASVASARAKAAAEKAFRNMVVDNNKLCSQCRLGKEKIAKRRLEIDGAIKQETKLKAQREAEKRRQSRGRGGKRSLAQASPVTSSVASEAQITNVEAQETKKEVEQKVEEKHEALAQKKHHHHHHQKSKHNEEWRADSEE